MYTVVRLDDSEEYGPFDDIADAEITAIESSIDDNVWAVRDDDEIVSLAYQSRIFLG